MLNRENKKYKQKLQELQDKYNHKWSEAFTNELLVNELKDENKKLQEELDVWKNKQLKKELQDLKTKLYDYEMKMENFM